MHEVFTEEALTQGITQLVGKPIVVYGKDGRKRKLGEVTSAHISDDRTGLMFHATITDEEVAGILGAAQDKNQRAASSIGLSDTEITAIIEAEGL